MRKVKINYSAVAGFVFCLMVISVIFGSACIGHKDLFSGISILQNKDVIIIKKYGIVQATWVNELEEHLKKSSVAAIVLWMESPGGMFADALLLHHNIQVLKEKYNKTIYVYTEFMLASGGYLAATAADSIIVSPLSRSGAIGIYTIRMDVTVKDSLDGIKYYIYQGGGKKVWGFYHVPMTEEESHSLLHSTTSAYNRFLQTVYESRFDRFQGALLKEGVTSDSLAVKILVAYVGSGELFGSYLSNKYGLVDDVLYFEEFVSRLRGQGYKVRNKKGTEIGTFYLEE